MNEIDPPEELPQNPEEETPDESGLRPDIIVLQMESFFDPVYMLDTTYSVDPIPNFRRLKENCASGWFSAPSIGAGTINTEFEVLTGMDLEFFGPGEYPYSTVLQEQTVESAAYVLGQLGYTTHAMHNNTGSFYSRYKVYPNLGFDSFTSLEYMEDPEYNATGWADDSVLTASILDCLRRNSRRGPPTASRPPGPVRIGTWPAGTIISTSSTSRTSSWPS